jgi:hypothetical protein
MPTANGEGFLCPAGHVMKRSKGSKSEGNLTCDGPDDRPCGRFHDGVLHPGDVRYSCIKCDFDICPACAEAEQDDDVKEVAPDAPEEKSSSTDARREALRRRLREKANRAREDTPTAQTIETVTEINASDVALTAAVGKGDLAELKECLDEHRQHATAKVAEEAKQALDRLKVRAKKERQKQRRSEVAAVPALDSTTPLPAVGEPVLETAFKFESSPGSEPVVAAASAFKFVAPPSSAASKPSTPAPVLNTTAANVSSPPALNFGYDSPVAKRAPAAAADGKDSLLGQPANPLLCPFSGELFTDPVVSADGYTYERKAISEYLAKHDQSPRTGEQLAHKELTPNLMALELCRRALSF